MEKSRGETMVLSTGLKDSMEVDEDQEIVEEDDDDDDDDDDIDSDRDEEVAGFPF
ncbi:hypothetical protein CASFOL_039325 [Castilleja foliolosa]|uniref:Uncharacterized protein n=1 Tax=Castilleja foliolosa TaxID=1961234 RepID=A0ABD3BIT0_9LAMI